MLDYLESGPRIWLIILWGLWAVILFGGFLLGSESETHRTPRWARLASSATLVFAGWSWFVLSPAGPPRSYALLIAIGMSLGFLGDSILAGVLPGGRNVLGGMGAFGLGHLFYIAAILLFTNQAGFDDAARRWGSLLFWWLVAALLWTFLIYRGQRATKLHWAALPYALLLATTTGLATGLALQSAHFWGLALGAALFLISDLILAMEIFTGLKFKSIGDVVWLTYGPGQMLIVYSIGAVIRFWGNM